MIFSNQLYYNINILINSEMKQLILIKVFSLHHIVLHIIHRRVSGRGGGARCLATPPLESEKTENVFTKILGIIPIYLEFFVQKDIFAFISGG